jgi:hypothetical protein
MRAFVIAVVVCAAASVEAAPWSFELPAGYTEEPGAADEQLEHLRKQEPTLSVDAQFYLSSEGDVQLTRLTWLIQPDERPSRATLEEMDRVGVKGASEQATKRVSDSRQWVSDQLVAASILEVDGVRLVSRRLYSADTGGRVHMFTVMCAGPPDQLGECEKAQQTMQLTLPNQATLRDAPPSRSSRNRSLAYEIGRIAGGVVLIALLIWLLRKPRR